MSASGADLEAMIIARIIDTGDMAVAIEHGVKSEWFRGTRSKSQWEYLLGYWSQHKQVPTEEAYNRRYPTWPLEVCADPLTGLIEELRRERKFSKLREGIAESVEYLSTADKDERPELTDEITGHLRGVLAEIETDSTRSVVEDTSDSFVDFLEELMEKEPQEMLGMPTGVDFIDRVLGGLQPEQFVVLVGPPKSSKSTILLWAAIVCQLLGKKILFISFEMSNLEQKQRMMSLGAHIDVAEIRKGFKGHPLARQMQRKMDDYVEDLTVSDGHLWLVHDHDRTVSGIAAKVEQYQPDLVCVDGLYLMFDDKGEPDGSPQALTNISRSLKSLAQTGKIPVYSTTQALESKMSAGKGVTMNSIGYTSAFAQDADALLGIWREDHTVPISRMRVIAARNAQGAEGLVEVDLGRGTIVDITTDNSLAYAGGGSSYGDDDDDD